MTDRVSYAPGPAAGAHIQKDGEAWTLVFARELHHAPEKVWEALTDPAQLREWAPYDADVSLAKVGTVNLSVVGTPNPAVSESKVTRADAPKELVHTWGDHNLRWELEPTSGGTRLTLWHTIDRNYISMGAAGWQICFDVLDDFLNGTPIGRIVGGDAMKHDWARLNKEFAAQFGVEAPAW
jgi:uncharacterized protein YndB with AHSA1/START domain